MRHLSRLRSENDENPNVISTKVWCTTSFFMNEDLKLNEIDDY